MEFSKITQRAIDIRKMYSRFEQKTYGAEWTTEEIALGFVGDVGDLAKLIAAKNGKRNITDAQSKLAHELADCLWSAMVLADRNEIDLEQAFLETMDDLEAHLTSSM